MELRTLHIKLRGITGVMLVPPGFNLDATVYHADGFGAWAPWFQLLDDVPLTGLQVDPNKSRRAQLMSLVEDETIFEVKVTYEESGDHPVTVVKEVVGLSGQDWALTKIFPHQPAEPLLELGGDIHLCQGRTSAEDKRAAHEDFSKKLAELMHRYGVSRVHVWWDTDGKRRGTG